MKYRIESFDPDIFEAIEAEYQREMYHLEMIASENFTFPEVMEAMGSLFTNNMPRVIQIRDIMVDVNMLIE